MYGKFSADECSGFALGVIRLTSKGDLGVKGIAGDAGFDLINTSSSKLMTDKIVEKSMLNLGFHKYYLKSGKWRHKYIEGNEVKDNETEEVTGVKFLQPGDMLVSTSHTEFYNGFSYDVTYNDMDEVNINVRKKSGISHIERKDRLELGYNNNGLDTKNDNRAYSTFGWGSVRDEYPARVDRVGDEDDVCFYFSYNKTSNNFELYYSPTSAGQKDYKVIWRKN